MPWAQTAIKPAYSDCREFFSGRWLEPVFAFFIPILQAIRTMQSEEPEVAAIIIRRHGSGQLNPAALVRIVGTRKPSRYPEMVMWEVD
jgi:hypothetical protein